MIGLPVIRHGLSIGTIDLRSQTVEVDQAHPIHFHCTSRTDCCSSMKIPASRNDIARILDHGYELDQIIEQSSPVILNSSSTHGAREKAYFLKRKPFDGTCTFLEDTLCNIHDFKPFACRIYPFELDFLSDHKIRVIIHQKQLCQSITGVPKSQANNEKILKHIMEIILDELNQRGLPIDSS